MSQQYSFEQISSNIDKIFQEVEQGEAVQITRQGKQLAVILPVYEYERLIDKKPGFWKSVQEFRQEMIEEGTEIDPDEVWENVRDKSPGRGIIL